MDSKYITSGNITCFGNCDQLKDLFVPFDRLFVEINKTIRNWIEEIFAYIILHTGSNCVSYFLICVTVYSPGSIVEKQIDVLDHPFGQPL